MANISLYEPLNTRLNRLFSHLGLNSPSLFDDQNELPGLSLKLDVAEDDENYLVRADLPGVKKMTSVSVSMGTRFPSALNTKINGKTKPEET